MNEVRAGSSNASMESLTAQADQLEAAVSDVWRAWSEFKHGIQPQEGTANLAQPVDNDRLTRVATSMTADISRLRTLAEEIRSRT